MSKGLKNLLVVAGAVIAVIIVALVVIYFTNPGLIGLGSASEQANSSAPSAPAVAPAVPPPARPAAMPPAKMASTKPGTATQNKAAKPNAKVAAKPKSPANPKAKTNVASAAGAPGKKPGAVKVASLVGAPAGARPDPFVIPGVRAYVPPKPSVVSFAPTPIVTNFVPPLPPAPRPPVTGPATVAELPNDRVSGIMLNNGVYAIMDADGQSQVVQPGDTLPGGEKVVSIQSDSVTLRTVDNQTVNLPLSAGASTATGNMGYPGGMPASYNGGGPPQYQMTGDGAP